jgi:hypothetical protein
MKINSAQRLKAGYDDMEIKEADPFDDWVRTLCFTYDRPDPHANHEILEATPHEVTLHLQNEGWAFTGRIGDDPPYSFEKMGKHVQLEPVDNDKTKLTLMDDEQQSV